MSGRPLTVTMRTPGDDFDLARGFLVSEGVVAADSDIAAIRYCAGATADGGNTYNVLDVLLDDGVAPPDPSLERNFYTTVIVRLVRQGQPRGGAHHQQVARRS